jgi:hypothetical protein
MQQFAKEELQSVVMDFLSLVDFPELPRWGAVSLPSIIEELGVWGLEYLLWQENQ